MTSAQEFQKKLIDLTQFIDQAIDQVQSGTIVSLQPVERDVDALCRQIEKSPTSVAHSLKPLMADAISRLDLLAESLQTLKSNLESKVK
jgi:hypothetical protein